jgi:hypothetical protein
VPGLSQRSTANKYGGNIKVVNQDKDEVLFCAFRFVASSETYELK